MCLSSDDSIIYGFNCITFIEYLIARRICLDCINLLSPNNYQQDNNKYFIEKSGKRKCKP